MPRRLFIGISIGKQVALAPQPADDDQAEGGAGGMISRGNRDPRQARDVDLAHRGFPDHLLPLQGGKLLAHLREDEGIEIVALEHLVENLEIGFLGRHEFRQIRRA